MWRQLTVRRLTTAILFLLLLAMAVRTPVDTDIWWHLRSGEYQIQNRTVVRADLFSHTRAGAPWINHSWASQDVLYLVYRLFGGNESGSAGLALLTGLLAAGGMAFVYAAGGGSVYVRALAVVLGAATAAVFWSPRPQMFTFFFSAVVYYLLWLYKWRHIDRLWLIPVVVLVWGNMHAGFATAFILLAGFIAGEVAGNLFGPRTDTVIGWRGIGRLAVIGLVSAAALVINPFGLDLLKLPLATVNIGVLQDFIQEWASPDFHQRQTWPFIWLLVGALGFSGLSSERLDWTDLALISGTGFMALLAGRNIALFAVVATPVLARHADVWLADHGWRIRLSERATPGMARLNWLLLALIALGVAGKIAYALNPAMIREAQVAALPVRAAEHINATRPEGLMFNSYNWGGYLMFAAPDYPVYVDGRTDLYGDGFLREYLEITLLQGDWRAALEKHDIGWVVIEARSLLANALREEPGWRLDYEDGVAAIFVRERMP